MKNFVSRLFGKKEKIEETDNSPEKAKTPHEKYLRELKLKEEKNRANREHQQQKANKLFQEQLDKGLYSFEVHLTIAEINKEQLIEFEDTCKKLDGKAILIALAKGKHTQQPMFTKTLVCKHIKEVYEAIKALQNSLADEKYTVIRQKVEIPLAQYDTYIKNYQKSVDENVVQFENCYFEWHGKFAYEHQYELNTLYERATKHNAHLSKNSLQNEKKTRFITLRHTDKTLFIENVEKLLSDLGVVTSSDFLKSQFEYCVFDNKLDLDNGWLGNPNKHTLEAYKKAYLNESDYSIKEFIACEAIIRRASMVKMPFMLKGSFITRQYFDNPNNRMPADVDFVCLTHNQDLYNLEPLLSEWMQKITETDADDGVYFTSFSENKFWRDIDYAMNDDFPTLSTDLTCTIDGESFETMVDISLNLDVPLDPVKLEYKTPIDSFTLTLTTPLALQIAWKIHQSIVRTRIKDIYDLVHLALAVDNKDIVVDAIEALYGECLRDDIDKHRIYDFFDYKKDAMNFEGSVEYEFSIAKKYNKDCLVALPDSYFELFDNFSKNMKQAGFTMEFVREILENKS